MVHGLRSGLVRGHERAAQNRLAVKLFVSRDQGHEREFSQKDEHDMAKRRFGRGPQCLDFTAIPCWGDGSHLENNWSGKRGKAIKSIQAALAHSPDTGIICYGDAGVRHDREEDVVLEFLDFYRGGWRRHSSIPGV